MGAPVRVMLNREYLVIEDGKPKFVRGHEATVAEDVCESPDEIAFSTMIDLNKDGTIDAMLHNGIIHPVEYATANAKLRYIIRDANLEIKPYRYNPDLVESRSGVEFIHVVSDAMRTVDRFKRMMMLAGSRLKNEIEISCDGMHRCKITRKDTGAEHRTFYIKDSKLPFIYPDEYMAKHPDAKNPEIASESIAISMSASAEVVVFGAEAREIWKMMRKAKFLLNRAKKAQ